MFETFSIYHLLEANVTTETESEFLKLREHFLDLWTEELEDYYTSLSLQDTFYRLYFKLLGRHQLLETDESGLKQYCTGLEKLVKLTQKKAVEKKDFRFLMLGKFYINSECLDLSTPENMQAIIDIVSNLPANPGGIGISLGMDSYPLMPLSKTTIRRVMDSSKCPELFKAIDHMPVKPSDFDSSKRFRPRKRGNWTFAYLFDQFALSQAFNYSPLINQISQSSSSIQPVAQAIQSHFKNKWVLLTSEDTTDVCNLYLQSRCASSLHEARYRVTKAILVGLYPLVLTAYILTSLIWGYLDATKISSFETINRYLCIPTLTFFLIAIVQIIRNAKIKKIASGGKRGLFITRPSFIFFWLADVVISAFLLIFGLSSGIEFVVQAISLLVTVILVIIGAGILLGVLGIFGGRSSSSD